MTPVQANGKRNSATTAQDITSQQASLRNKQAPSYECKSHCKGEEPSTRTRSTQDTSRLTSQAQAQAHRIRKPTQATRTLGKENKRRSQQSHQAIIARGKRTTRAKTTSTRPMRTTNVHHRDHQQAHPCVSDALTGQRDPSVSEFLPLEALHLRETPTGHHRSFTSNSNNNKARRTTPRPIQFEPSNNTKTRDHPVNKKARRPTPRPIQQTLQGAPTRALRLDPTREVYNNSNSVTASYKEPRRERSG
jgi:hypothetical protein